MLTVGAFDAKTRLSALLDAVEKGEEVVITRHGKPIARIVPEMAGDDQAERVSRAIEGLKSLRKDVKIGSDWRDLRDAGRK